jgi:hypothetical protein
VIRSGKAILQSLGRIVAGVIVGTVALALALVLPLRQPNFGSVPFPGGLRSDAERLKTHVLFLTDPHHSRCADNSAGLQRAASYIEAAFRQTHGRYSEQSYTAGGIQTKNLILDLGPEAGQRLVVGAHYDVFSDFPGADDNASGVAGILELARLLDHQSLSSPVELVAYSTEEPPYFATELMGSAIHANALARSGARVRAMISLEMIGYFSVRQHSLNPLLYLLYPKNGEFIAIVGRWQDRALARAAKECFRGATTVQPVSYSGPVAPGADLSDQRNYWAQGYPGLMITDTAFMRNAKYHTPDDTPDTLDYGKMAGVVDGALNTVLHLANRP